MPKMQKYLGIEVKKKGKGFEVDCALVVEASSRNNALKILKEHVDMKPGIILTEKEARKMYDTLSHILRRGEIFK